MTTGSVMVKWGGMALDGDTIPFEQRKFLDAYIETKTITGASRVMNVGRMKHYYWMERVEGYPEAFEIAKIDVVDQWREIYSETTQRGLREELYDKDGNLKHTRYRQDAGLLKTLLTNIDPEFSVDGDRAKTIVVVVNRTNEGGWTEK